MKVLEVIAVNKARQRRARALNIRAGADLFRVYSGSELVSFVVDRLNGARRQAEIARPEELLLPELDSAEVARVERENPSEIKILGRATEVRYVEGHTPVAFLGNLAEGNRWQELPDNGIFLPSGRQIEVEFWLDHYSFRGGEGRILKDRALSHLAREQWMIWLESTTRPEIALPDTNDASSEVAPIIEATYGKCVVTGAPLMAFGAVVVNSHCYYSTDLWFEVKWFQRRDEAEAERSKAVEKLAAFHKEVAERTLLAAARQEAEAAKEKLNRLYEDQRDYLPAAFCDEIRRTSYSRFPDTLGGLRQWVVDVNSLADRASAKAAEVKAAHDRETLEIAPLVAHVQDNYRADFIRDFVAELVKNVGAAKAHRRLSTEFTADYGRARRQSALADICRGEKGQQFLAYNQARVFDEVLEGAIFWLEHKYGLRPIAQSARRQAPTTEFARQAPRKNDPPGNLGSSFGDAFGDVFAKLKIK